jgi:hypothetical protein
MRRPRENALSLLAATLSTGALVACGGGGAHPSPATVASAAGATKIASAVTSGPAASFLVPRGDNSIPEFGREAPASERGRALAALAAFLRARAGDEWSRACSDLIGGTRRQLTTIAKTASGKPEGCGRMLAALSPDTSVRARAEMPARGPAALRVRGPNAFLLFYGADGGKYVMPVADEAGAWKMSKLAPIAYPPVPTGPAAP